AAENIDKEEADKLAAKMMKGVFTLEDMAKQFKQIKKMGDMQGLLGMLPGAAKVKQQMAQANVDDKMISRQEAIILSMTPAERRNPKILNGSRRRRIAAGSGSTVQEVNRLLKQFLQMSKMMKKMGKLGKKGMMRGMGGMPPGALPPMPHQR
ncbi:MAG: signal recognition particle protein, partial [Rhodospirillales bacterium]|nr:signal recognition particle protein [Rhodospirillales bacterium]